MKIVDFKLLIQNMPVQEQSFTLKRSNKKWQNAEKKYDWVYEFNEKYFDKDGSLTINRKELIEESESKYKILKIIYWGYPTGMQGYSNFKGILNEIDKIIRILNNLSHGNLSSNDYKNTLLDFKKIKGLGLSTYSKFLYFFNINWNGYKSLILDQRLIDVFKNKIFEDFNQISAITNYNAATTYLDYLKIMNDLAKELQTNPDNIEQFLFTFGKNLKSGIN